MGWIIFLRVLLSVSANAVQKRLLLNRAGVNPTWILTYSIMIGPAMLLAGLSGGGGFETGPGFWSDIILGGGLDAIGNLAMVAALRSTDISVFGPLNALRPILALLFGWFFLGETPSWMGLAGIAITVAGGVVLFSGPLEKQNAGFAGFSAIWKPLALRTLGLSLGVVGAVFLKRAALAGSAGMTVAVWIVCGLICLLLFAAGVQGFEFRSLGEAFVVHRGWLLVHAAVFLAMQWLTIWIFQETLLAYAFVFFQLGMVLQVFVGRFFFREAAFARRLVAALIMAAGSVLILWKG